MSHSPRILLLATLTTVAIVAACGGGTAAEPTDGTSSPAASSPAEPAQPTTEPSADAGAPEPGTTKDACEVITAADVAAATGADPTEVEPGTLKETPTSLSPGRTECTYQGDGFRIIVSLTPEDGVNLYDAAEGSYDDALPLDGIGDGAFYSAANDRAFFLDGNVAILITAFAEDQQAVVTELGTRGLANL